MASIFADKETNMYNIQSTLQPKLTFRGDYQHGEIYKEGDYVYVPEKEGYLYVALNLGRSQSATEATTGLNEPVWTLTSYFYEGVIQYTPKVLTFQEAFFAIPWRPKMSLSLGDIVVPFDGPIDQSDGKGESLLGYEITKIVANPDWPIIPGQKVQDDTVEWECRLSYSKLLPPARRKEDMFRELYQIMDFLELHKELYFNDCLYKYKEFLKVRPESLKQLVTEFGYNYVVDALNVNDEELRVLVHYIGIIHALKGSLNGLDVVFKLLGVKYHHTEWWETTPKGVPHTWELSIEVDLQKATSDIVTRLISFARQYVYPIMSKFDINYFATMSTLGLTVGGFHDQEYSFPSVSTGAFVLSGIGGFIDKEYKFDLSETATFVLGKNRDFENPVFGFGGSRGLVQGWGSDWARYNPYTMSMFKVIIAWPIGEDREDEKLYHVIRVNKGK